MFESLIKGLAIASCAMLVANAQVDWPGFKGAGGTGIGQGPAPVTWDVAQPATIKWKTAIPGVGHSSPIVWGGRVYLTTAVPAHDATYSTTMTEDMRPVSDDQIYSWRVLCLDAARGAVIWERILHEGKPKSQRHALNSFATPTPVTDGRHLIVYMGSEGLYGLDMDGRVLWTKRLGVLNAGFSQDTTLQWGIASSPLLYKDFVIIQADVDEQPFLAAYAKSTGERAWTTPRADGQSWSTPAIHTGPSGDTLVAIAPKHARGYDPITGRELWKYRWDLDIVLSTPTSANGLIYVSSGKGPTQPILAIRPSARGDITLAGPATASEAIAWSSTRGGPIVTSPLVSGEWLYALSDLGVLRCLSASTGAVQYQERLPGTFLSSPVAADGKIYLTSTDGNVFVVAAGPIYRLLGVNNLGEPAAATPAFDRGTIIIRTLHHVYAIAARDERVAPQPRVTIRKR